MLNLTLRSAYWTLVVFFLGASGLVAADMESRSDRMASSPNFVVSSARN
jgi:hypothetical protein